MQVARRADGVSAGHCADQLFRRHAVRPQPVRVDPDYDRPLVASERGRRRHARQSGEHRPHLEQRLVLDLRDRLGRTRQHQVPHRDAARIEPHHERGDGSGGHESAGAVDVGNRLGHGLGHVRPRMKKQLHQRCTLDVFALDVMDAADVQEVVLVIICQQPFHLRRVHAPVRLADVDHRQVQPRKDIDGHPLERQLNAGTL